MSFFWGVGVGGELLTKPKENLPAACERSTSESTKSIHFHPRPPQMVPLPSPLCFVTLMCWTVTRMGHRRAKIAKAGWDRHVSPPPILSHAVWGDNWGGHCGREHGISLWPSILPSPGHLQDVSVVMSVFIAGHASPVPSVRCKQIEAAPESLRELTQTLPIWFWVCASK